MSAPLVGQAQRAATELELILRDRATLVALADMADADGVCWPGAAFVAELTGCGLRTARRSLQSLTEVGLIDRRRRGPRSSLTVLNLEALKQHSQRFDDRRRARHEETKRRATHGTPSAPKDVPPMAPLEIERRATCDQRRATGDTKDVPRVTPKSLENHQLKPPPPPQPFTHEDADSIGDGGGGGNEVGAVVAERVASTFGVRPWAALNTSIAQAMQRGCAEDEIERYLTDGLETGTNPRGALDWRIDHIDDLAPAEQLSAVVVGARGYDCRKCRDTGEWRNPDENDWQPCPDCDQGF